SSDQIFKDLSNQQLTVAAVSRIVLNKLSDPAENENVYARVSDILETLKISLSILQDFRDAAADNSQDRATQGMNGYMGDVIKGTFPELDDVLFSKKAPEGLYPEIIETPESYQLIYVENPMKSGKMKDFPDIQNGQSFQLYVVNFLNSNAQVLYTYDLATHTYTSEKNELVDPETFTANTVVARFWKKNYTVAQVSSLILATAPAGAVAPQPAEVVQLLAETNDTSYRFQLAVLLRSYKEGGNRKEIAKISNDTAVQLDTQNAQAIIEGYLLDRIETNVTAQEVDIYYNNMPERPIIDYRNDGTPIYATIAEARPQIEQAIVGMRFQQEFITLMNKASEERSLEWKEANLPVFSKVLAKEHKKATTQQ
ncbi:MAG: peptidylprolyl isomerase, partial [Brevinema sp.]